MTASRTGQIAKAFSGWTVVVLIWVALTVTGWLLYRREAAQIATRQAELEVVRVNLLTQLLRGELRPVVDDLRLLADGDGLRNYLETGSPAALQAATRRAVFFSRAKPLYDQVRYIDESGQEVIRVNQGGALVSGAQLQNKADRPYFRESSGLAPGTLYISSFDLNVEGHALQAPFKPTLRFAVPVFDAAGRRRGIYVINCEGRHLIDTLQRAAAVLVKRVRLLNAQGYWLKGASAEQEWGFMLPGRAQFTLARSDPALWGRMQHEPLGQAFYAGGLITWQRLRPVEFTGTASLNLAANDPFLIIASAIAAPEWEVLFAGLRELSGFVVAVLVLLTLLSAGLYNGRMRAIRELRVLNEQLESRVRERTDELARSYQQLQHRERLLEETGQLAKVGGWEVDPFTGDGDWTPEMARIHEVDPRELSRHDVRFRSYTPASRVKLQAALQEAREKGTPYDLELEIITARGFRKWVRTICHPVVADGKVRSLRGALQDISTQKQYERRLQSKLQRLHLLEQITRSIGERQDLSSILQVVIRTLEEELPLDFGCICLYEPLGRILTVAAVGIAGSSLATQLAMGEHARIPIDQNGLSRCVRGQLVYEPDVAGSSFSFPKRLAAAGLRALVAAPLQIESQVFGVLISARRAPDSFSSAECEFLRQLSEHVALAAHQAQLHSSLQLAYEELRATQQSVMQQERLRVLGQMASGIAHDINNAISPIALYTDSLLEQEQGLSERARAYLQTIQQATSDVSETVARMREFYRQRVGQGDLAPLDINPILSQIVELTRARWEAMPQQGGNVVEVRVEAAPHLPPVLGALSEIREALTNLVFNAVDAMPKGGTLILRSRLDGKQRVAVEVVDSGVGMDEETRRRCLEPFFTTKGERGTGLGLAMVYGVMQRHGGDLEIESSPGVGTTVRLCFAIAGDASVATQEVALLRVEPLTLLLVDDDPILLKSLRETLEGDGHTILAANGGRQGIELFRASIQSDGRSSISAVITDLGMPHVDGRSVARAVKQASGTTAVILLTGWGERLLADGEIQPNVDRVLSKPPRLRELRKALTELTTNSHP